MQVQQEVEKLKKLYKTSSKALEDWPLSDLVSCCEDQNFAGVLQRLSELELETAVHGLQRKIEIELLLVKNLERLRITNSDCPDTICKLISSQAEIARLRSRLLRCLSKQLNDRGHKECILPSWHSRILNNKERTTATTVETRNEDQSKAGTQNVRGGPPENKAATDMSNSENATQLDEPMDSNTLFDSNSEKRESLGIEQIPLSSNELENLHWVQAKDVSSLPFLQKDTESCTKTVDTVMEESNRDEDGDENKLKESPSKLVSTGSFSDSAVQSGEDLTERETGLKKIQETLEKNLHEKGHLEGRHNIAGSSTTPPPKPPPYNSMGSKENLGQANASLQSAEVLASLPGDDIPDGVMVTEQPQMQDWDPTLLLHDIFGEAKDVVSPTEPAVEEPCSVGIVRMSGFMEKLPSSYKQKKSTVFKGWKKRHFKAFDGKLFYFERAEVHNRSSKQPLNRFESSQTRSDISLQQRMNSALDTMGKALLDHRINEPLGMVDLKGCSVIISNGRMLELIDSEGKAALKVRCATSAEAEDWKEALEEEAKNQESCAQEKMDSSPEGSVIVIDLGSSSVKAGFASEEAWPQVIFPCVCAELKDDESDCVYGFGALEPERRKKSNLRFPLRRSLKIDKLKFSPSDLTGILEHIFNSLKVDPAKHKVIMTLPQNTSLNDKGELVEILLGFFGVEACYLQEQSILAMYSYSAVSGIIVDIGDHIDVIPVVEGCVIEAGSSRLPYGGRQVTDMLARLLTEKGHRFFSEVESYITRFVKEKACYVTEKRVVKDEDMSSNPVDVMLTKYNIPDGTKKVTFDSARYRCTEGLFEPIVWGKDHPGIHDLTHKAIMACSIDVRKQMCRSIYLGGGGTMLPGFAERLQSEVKALLPSLNIVQVHAGTDRQHAAFIGASVVARLPLFEELCITQDDWNDIGKDALEKWQNL